MKVAEVWIEAAELAEMWAGITRARARRLSDEKKQAVHVAAADQVDALARAYRHKAASDQREIDFDDQPTPVVPDRTASQVGLLELDEDDTDTDPDTR